MTDFTKTIEKTQHHWSDDRQNEYVLSWFQVLTFRPNIDTGESKFVVYGVGRWYRHLMDWRGCNFFHGRIPGSPTFKTIEDAVLWLDEAVKAGVLSDRMRLHGHHSGENTCPKGCDEREVIQVSINSENHIQRKLRKPGVHVTKFDAQHHGLKLPAAITY